MWPKEYMGSVLGSLVSYSYQAKSNKGKISPLYVVISSVFLLNLRTLELPHVDSSATSMDLLQCHFDRS